MNTPVARRRHPAALMVLLLGALAVIATVVALLQTSTEARAEVATASQTQVEEGRTLYLEGCASCHGLEAQGSSTAPSLIGVGAAAVHFQVATGRMPLAAPVVQAERKDPVYDGEQIAALAAYIATLGPGPAIPTEEQLDTTNADLARGGSLFRTNCAQCHNFAGAGRCPDARQEGALAHGGHRAGGLRGHAHRPAEHAGVRRRHADTRRTSTTSSPTSPTCRTRPSPAAGTWVVRPRDRGGVPVHRRRRRSWPRLPSGSEPRSDE